MAKDKDPIRVPGTTTLLVNVLDRIIREHLKFVPNKHPGWTFDHNANYRVEDGSGYEHECSSYIGSSRVEGKTEEGEQYSLELRVHVVRNNWTALPSQGSELWFFNVWARTPDRDFAPPVFLYSERDDHLFLSENYPEHTPRKIDLWWRRFTLAEPHEM